jgi:hypothetical protein
VTWDDLRTHLRNTLVLSVDEPSRVGLNWEFPNGDDVQRQYVSPVSAFGRPHLQIVSNVVVENAMSSRDAMALNAQLAIGALCVADGYLLLRAVVPLEGVDVTVLEQAIHNVAHEATQVRIHAVSKPAVVPHAE